MILRMIVVLIVLGIASGEAAQDRFKADEIVHYKTVGDVDLNMHMFYPEGHQATDQRPAVVFFFGGGWKKGTARQMYQYARTYSDLGFVAMSAEYRIAGKHQTTPYECVEDGKSALRWARRQAGELGIDPNRIIAGGASAGGHVAACTVVIAGFDEEGEDTSVSCAPNALVLYNPVLDFSQGNEKGAADDLTDPKFQISPAHHVRAGLPPTIIFHGTADSIVRIRYVETYVEKAVAAGNQCELVPFEGKKHGFINGSHFRPNNGDEDFLAIMEHSRSFLADLGFIE